MPSRGHLSWRERLRPVRAAASPEVLTRSLLGLRRLAHRTVSAVLERLVVKIPDHSPGDPFSAGLELGPPLLQ